MKITPTKKKLIIRIAIAALIALALIVVTVFFLERRGVINLTKDNTRDTFSEEAETTSQAPSAQADFSEGNIREPAAPTRTNAGTSLITDSNGSISPSTNTSNPQVSSTGEISVFTPRQNTVLASGQEVAGTSTLPTVSYRIIDDISGVIATGTLQVVNGTFAGTLTFNTNATQGRIDFYGARADGTEFSNIDISVRFR